ncbi:MBL fold metallo-hydrolase [Bacillus aquiflavi]|uniref:MBL fold metallo-hydrolase n=1 Tax=Bacillus aquiflavi TaxID=2672567 RepID=A0A6B3VV28_9BACI|nr:MBL fold metallo-hydrolase [Bacillus aquiflavi]MBA4535811.1 MBL fold metallo-hydrolase [Bacillus aquiflavi]NEY80187.1 MBL fold metallo-hydrolase [Bacillus aquiflavi]
MKWKQIPLGPLQTNCYVLVKENKCLIVDPGGEEEKLLSYMKSEQLIPKGILLTHAHFDHIGAVDKVREYFNIPVYIHEKEADWLVDPKLNGSQLFPVGVLIQTKRADKLITKEETITIEEFSFQVFETPGHSPGSVSFYFATEGIVVSGDTLFNGSIGRTDLPGGNHEQLLNSIHEKLLTLSEKTLVLPGHGPITTIGTEMDVNPFLNGF